MTAIGLGHTEESSVLAQTTHLEDKLVTAIEEQRSMRLHVGLLHITVDIQTIELKCGPATSRRLINELQTRLEGSIRKTDIRVHESFGTFGVVLPGLGTEADLQLVAESVHNALSAPFDLPERQLQVGVHIGAAMCRRGPRGVRTCIRSAALSALKANRDHVSVSVSKGSRFGSISRRLGLRPPAQARKTDITPWSGIRSDSRWAAHSRG
ncbi:MAG: hypothetical protein QOG04_1961 [Actinomycetota bacterium]|nr:hypothetical protein [Actinomycetota bacterium]